jgi:hypothetical protein
MDVLLVYGAARARLGDEEGLRLRLHLPAELAGLPWELLCYSSHYLATDPRSPVVRFLDLPDPPRPLRTRPPLRLLHLIANPQDAPPLEVEREEALLRSALEGFVDLAEVVPGRPGSTAVLLDGLRTGCQVLHFSGHGGLAGESSYLLFEDGQGRSQRVDGDTLAHLLQGSSVRLAILNACQSAVSGAGDAFRSVAAALVRAGLPAVIAHQSPLPDGSATAFAGAFYRALADGYPVDAAVGEGRKAILAELGAAWRARVDWAVPVLFMRAPDGKILTLRGSETPGASGSTSVPDIHQEVTAMGDAATIGTVSGGEVSIAFGTARQEAQPVPRQDRDDPLPRLMIELRQVVRDWVPEDKRQLAQGKVASLEEAIDKERPNLAQMQSVLAWFETEVPSLSGPVLNTILGSRSRVEKAGDDLLLEYRQRFGTSE